MDAPDLCERTSLFSLRINLVRKMPRNMETRTLGGQVLRSGTSIGANYREARVARSNSEFAAKLALCRGEADETVYWLDLMIRSGMVRKDKLEPLLKEAKELAAIFAASTIKAVNNNVKPH